jgi:4-diphosphocytidyl-2-C-methyl-D-erythritol kinase
VPEDVPMRLGADVTVMLRAERALMTGAGELVEPLPGKKPPLIVVPVDAALGAGEVYREFDAHDTPRTPDELAAAAEALRHGVFEPVNDLERAARRLCPLIDRALQALRDVGAEQPMVTGSGPTVFGISDDPEALAFLQHAYPRAVAA